MLMSFRHEEKVLDYYEIIQKIDGRTYFENFNGRTQVIDVDPDSYVGSSLKYLKNNGFDNIEFIIIDNQWYLDYKNMEDKLYFSLKCGQRYVQKEFWGEK